MFNQVHVNRVLYNARPEPGHKYRQIAVVEKQQFQVRIFEGGVVQLDPEFIANSSDAEVYFHPTLKSAVEDADKEFNDSVAAGWQPYAGGRE